MAGKIVNCSNDEYNRAESKRIPAEITQLIALDDPLDQFDGQHAEYRRADQAGQDHRQRERRPFGNGVRDFEHDRAEHGGNTENKR